jgi:hypothetical protein
MKRLATLLVILAVGACSRTPAPEVGELRVIPLGGQVRLIEDGETSLLDEAATVDAGIQLQTGLDGRAQVQLPGGPSLELAPGASVQLDDGISEVARGNVLVRTNGTDITVRAGDAEIAASDAVFRLEKDYSVLLAVYAGEASVMGTGFPAVTALRQMAVLAGGEPSGSAKPLQVDPNDPWDTELLGPAIDLGLRLVGLEKGLTRQLPSNDQATAVSRALAGDFSPRSIESAITSLNDAARAVVAAVVANQISRLDGVSPIRALAEVVELYTASTQWQWIVVAAQWGLAQVAGALIDDLGTQAASITRTVAPQPVSVTGGGNETGLGQTPAPGDTNEGTDPGPKDDKTTNTGSEPPEAPPAEDPADDQPAAGCSSDIECAIDDVLDDYGPGNVGSALTLQ